ncbi:hypothetical protein F5Y02DRAFT_373322 [Annulohypoxylon stygium]|nr:hypothetical protein F5Y02DRAFT_373322 [Annulohypoxylon stygium]
MDPATAIGLACSILSLIDFSYKVISGTYKIAKHGSTVEYDNVESVVQDLHTLTVGLQSHELKGTPPHETALKELASKCETLSKELSALLQTLKATEGSRWDAIIVSLRSARKKAEVAKKRSMLAEYRSQVSVQLLALLNERHVLIWTRIEWEFKEQHADLVQRLSDLQVLVQDILDSQTRHDMCLVESKDEVLPSENMREILAVLGLLAETSRPAPPEVRILRQLYFKSMYDREDSVGDAGVGTCKWLLGEDEELEEGGTFIGESLSGEMIREATEIRQLQSQARVNFLNWLCGGNRIFHISGKAGSGKSTLVKFLAYHYRTQEQLNIWSGDKRLIFAHFFAWNAGPDGLSDSIYGLCRSILFTVLKQCPDLIPEAFPDAYRIFLRTPYEPFIDEPLFRYSEVVEGLRKLTTRSASYGYRFCFFIDGLDEFKNDFASRHSHKLLADILTSWAENDDVKLLVSSRPTNEFISAFSDDLRIKLHELTKFDIMHFGKTEFEKNTEFARVKDFYMTLVNRVTEEAQGVFLWARLTIAKLLQAIKDIQDVNKLVKLIDDAPKDIHNLYQSLLDSIDSSYRNKILKILWLVGQGISCRMLWITWVDELFTPGFDFPAEYEIEAYSDTEIEMRLREADFLILQAKGLLEFETRGAAKGTQLVSSSVTFSHRTVCEFVMRSDQMHMFSRSLQGLDGLKIEVKAMLAELWFLNDEDSQVLTHGLGKKLEFKYSWRSGREDAAVLLRAFEELIQRYITNGVALPKQTITSYIFNRARLATPETKLSYLHWVAGCVGDWEYLSHKLQNQPELVHANWDLSILLSAAVSQFDNPIFYRLLEMGASPNETIQLTHPSGSSEASIWAIFCMVVATSIVEAVAYSRRLHDSSWNDILSYYSHKDFYRIFCERLEMFLKMGDVNRDVFIFMGQKGIHEKDNMESDGTHIVSLKDLIKQFDKANADSWEELFNPNRTANGNSQDIWSYLTMNRFYDTWNNSLSYTTKILKLDNLAIAWNHMTTQSSQAARYDQVSRQKYQPFRLGMKANKGENLFYVHSVMAGETIVSAWDMEVRMF